MENPDYHETLDVIRHPRPLSPSRAWSTAEPLRLLALRPASIGFLSVCFKLILKQHWLWTKLWNLVFGMVQGSGDKPCVKSRFLHGHLDIGGNSQFLLSQPSRMSWTLVRWLTFGSQFDRHVLFGRQWCGHGVLDMVDGYSWMSNVPDANPNSCDLVQRVILFWTWFPSSPTSHMVLLLMQHGLLRELFRMHMFWDFTWHMEMSWFQLNMVCLKTQMPGVTSFNFQHVSIDQPCRQGSRVGSQPSSSSRSERPQMWRMLAVFRESQRLRERINKYGQWTHCAVCNLRTQYIPRMGSLTHNVEHIDPHHVAKALSMVHKDLKGVKPHHKLMKVAVEKIESDERYYQMELQKWPQFRNLPHATRCAHLRGDHHTTPRRSRSQVPSSSRRAQAGNMWLYQTPEPSHQRCLKWVWHRFQWWPLRISWVSSRPGSGSHGAACQRSDAEPIRGSPVIENVPSRWAKRRWRCSNWWCLVSSPTFTTLWGSLIRLMFGKFAVHLSLGFLRHVLKKVWNVCGLIWPTGSIWTVLTLLNPWPSSTRFSVRSGSGFLCGARCGVPGAPSTLTLWSGWNSWNPSGARSTKCWGTSRTGWSAMLLMIMLYCFFGNGLPITKYGTSKFFLIYKMHCAEVIATGCPAELMVAGMGWLVVV